jgi:hypothetical protein
MTMCSSWCSAAATRRWKRHTVLAQRHPGRVGVTIGYREEDAHLLHAGADALLHGSRFEPFGLTPVYAMRYGTVPIVSRVGAGGHRARCGQRHQSAWRAPTASCSKANRSNRWAWPSRVH